MKTHAKTSRTTATPAAAAPLPAARDNDTALDVSAIPHHSFAGVAVTPAPPGAIQPRLMVGGAHDRYEDEADRVAGQVMRMPDAQVQRLTPEEDEDTIQTMPDLQRRAEGSFAAGAAVEERIRARRGRGSPLPEATRAFMEPRFGADFSRVRVHADAEADQISHDLSARAFTTGRDIYFRRGAYSPRSASGQELLAHELAHVVQQRQSGAAGAAVQRLVGFEAELSVPVFEAENDDPVQSFLFGGDQRAIKVGENEAFTLMKEVSSYPKILANLATLLGYGEEEAPNTSMLEYKTVPVGEFARDADRTLQTQGTAIRAHAASLAGASTNMAPLPEAEDGVHYGIPEGPIMERAKKLNCEEQARAILASLQRELSTDRFDLQATVGILPSVVAKFFRNESRLNTPENRNLARVMDHARAELARAVNALLQDNNLLNAKANDEATTTIGNIIGANAPARGAFEGWMSTICSYVIGEALAQTDLFANSDAKNAVPYLSKLNPGYWYTTFPDELSRYINKYQVPPAETRAKIKDYFISQPQAKPDYWVARFNTKLQNKPEHVVEGGDSEKFVDQVLQCLPVTMKGGRSFDEAESILEGRSGEEEIDTEVNDAIGNQRAAQFEYRYLGSANADGLLAKMMQVLDEVRELNTSGMAVGMKQRLLRQGGE